jgi:integrase
MGPIGPILIGAALLAAGFFAGKLFHVAQDVGGDTVDGMSAVAGPAAQPHQNEPTISVPPPLPPLPPVKPAIGPIGPIAKTCPQIALELLVDLRQDGASKRWERTLAGQLARFGKRFNGPISSVKAAEINEWLRSLGVGVRCRNNYRAAIVRLVRYAQGRGYLAADWREIIQVEKPKVRRKEIKILGPDELVKLLAGTKPNMVAFTALQAFAGLRHEEIVRMKWSDIDLAARQIYVPISASKVPGSDRIVPMADNLRDWLLSVERRAGPVVKVGKTSMALGRAKGRAGIRMGKNETRNILRKSWISYRLAVTKNITLGADEAGNSPGVIKTNYRRPVAEAEAAAWFALVPGDEKTRQLILDLPGASTLEISVEVAQDSNLRPTQKPAQPPQTNGFEKIPPRQSLFTDGTPQP